MPARPDSGNEGPAVDRHGNPVIDPTKNVLDLVEAAIRRQDGLRRAEARRVDQKFKSMREFALAETAHVKQVIRMRAEHERELREAESQRINAIRNVDVNAMAVSNERAAAQTIAMAQQIAGLTSQLAAISGSGTGRKDVWGYIIAGSTVMVAVAGLVIAAIMMGK